jgi:hypothetical protein
MTTEDFPITSYVHACPLCQAAKDFNSNGKDLKTSAERHGVRVSDLKRRLGLVGVRRNWDEHEIAAFTEDIDAGMTTEELAEKWQMSKSRVNQLVTKFGIDPGPGRRQRARKDAVRFGEVAEAVIYTYDLEPNLTVEANFEWAKAMGLVPNLTLEAVQDVFTRVNLEPGELDAMPTDQAAVEIIHDQRDGSKKEHRVEDTQLPEHIDDDVVTVPQRSLLDWVRLWLSEEPNGTIEDYAKWAKNYDDAPTTREIREEHGGWGKAKKKAAAEA